MRVRSKEKDEGPVILALKARPRFLSRGHLGFIKITLVLRGDGLARVRVGGKGARQEAVAGVQLGWWRLGLGQRG